MTPLLNPITRAERRYNFCHIRTRNVVERQYGVWKRRFPVLSSGLKLKVENALVIIVATAVLHNIAINNNDDEPNPTQNENDDGEFEEVVQDLNTTSNMIRQTLIDEYFSNLNNQ